MATTPVSAAVRPSRTANVAPPSRAKALPAPEDLLSIVRLLPDVVFKCVKDDHGDIRWVFNEGRLAEEFHVTTADVEGKTLFEMFPPPVAEMQLPHFEAAFRGEEREWTNEMGGRSFKHFPQPIRDATGKIVAVVGFISEVTSLVEAQRQAQMLNAELLQRLVDLREANARLAQANRDLDAFAAAASHDLKSPLSTVATNAYLLERSLVDPGDQERLRKISTAARRMSDLTTDLLRFSRAAASEFRPATVDVTAMVHEVAAALSAAHPDQRVAWSIDEGLTAWADPGLLRVALDNLLGNAWKYTQSSHDATIAVRAEGVSKEGHPILAVADNGIGFRSEDASRLFQAFERLPGSERFPGTGLGLATVRRIIERHGGRIWAEGRPGHGATFTVSLPPQPAPPASAPQ